MDAAPGSWYIPPPPPDPPVLALLDAGKNPFPPLPPPTAVTFPKVDDCPEFAFHTVELACPF
jgi:hypothetical protein